MDDYRAEVERFASERTGDPFYNSSLEHAAVIIEKMFAHARNEVCIISSHLNARVFGRDEVVDEVQAFLGNANHKVRIILEDDFSALSDGHELLRELRKHTDNVEVRQLSDGLKDVVKYHFTLVDEDSYRFEPDKSKWEAVAAFGDVASASKLKSIFDSIWGNSRPVSLAIAA